MSRFESPHFMSPEIDPQEVVERFYQEQNAQLPLARRSLVDLLHLPDGYQAGKFTDVLIAQRSWPVGREARLRREQQQQRDEMLARANFDRGKPFHYMYPVSLPVVGLGDGSETVVVQPQRVQRARLTTVDTGDSLLPAIAYVNKYGYRVDQPLPLFEKDNPHAGILVNAAPFQLLYPRHEALQDEARSRIPEYKSPAETKSVEEKSLDNLFYVIGQQNAGFSSVASARSINFRFPQVASSEVGRLIEDFKVIHNEKGIKLQRKKFKDGQEKYQAEIDLGKRKDLKDVIEKHMSSLITRRISEKERAAYINSLQQVLKLNTDFEVELPLESREVAIEIREKLPF
jgi:hypothetical protein